MIELYTEGNLLLKSIPSQEYSNLRPSIKSQFPTEGHFAFGHLGEWWPSEDGTKEYQVVKAVVDGEVVEKEYERPHIREMVNYSHFNSLYGGVEIATISKTGNEVVYRGLRGLLRLIAKRPPAENGQIDCNPQPLLYYKKFSDNAVILEYYDGNVAYAHRHEHAFDDLVKYNAYCTASGYNVFGSK